MITGTKVRTSDPAILDDLLGNHLRGSSHEGGYENDIVPCSGLTLKPGLEAMGQGGEDRYYNQG